MVKIAIPPPVGAVKPPPPPAPPRDSAKGGQAMGGETRAIGPEIVVGERYLVTTNEWFVAPDGEQYRAVFGTVRGVENSEETLGVKTNSRSTNWYLVIGRMIVAGCQIHYAIRAEQVRDTPATREIEHEGKLVVTSNPRSHIYRAD